MKIIKYRENSSFWNEIKLKNELKEMYMYKIKFNIVYLPSLIESKLRSIFETKALDTFDLSM